MPGPHLAELELIRVLQALRSPLADALFLLLSALGSREFYWLLIAWITWCVRRPLGIRVGVLFLLSSLLNAGLKDLFQQPRPLTIEPLLGVWPSDGYGLPSGHAQAAAAVWGYLAASAGRGYAGAAAAAFLIGLSRVYLGAHFPTDVIAGWAVGVLLAALFVAAERRLGARFASSPATRRIAAAAGLGALLVVMRRTADVAWDAGGLVGLVAGAAIADPLPALPGSRRRRVAIGIGPLLALLVERRLAHALGREPVLLAVAGGLLLGLWVGVGTWLAPARRIS